MPDAVEERGPQEVEEQEAPENAAQGPVPAVGPEREQALAQEKLAGDAAQLAGRTVAEASGVTLDNLQRMLDVPLDMTVELGRTEMQLSEVLNLQPGSVIEINRLPGEPIDLLVNGSLFARGEIVVINDTFGYRIIELVAQAPESRGIGSEGE